MSVTFEFCPMVAAVPKSESPSAKAMSPPAKMAGNSNGELILNHARHVRAPIKRAASSNSEPSHCRAALTERYTNGNVFRLRTKITPRGEKKRLSKASEKCKY